MKKIHLITGLLCMLFYSPMAFAYIGPGLGTGVITTVLGVLAGLLMLLVGVIWYPVKRLIKWLRSKMS